MDGRRGKQLARSCVEATASNRRQAACLSTVVQQIDVFTVGLWALYFTPTRGGYRTVQRGIGWVDVVVGNTTKHILPVFKSLSKMKTEAPRTFPVTRYFGEAATEIASAFLQLLEAAAHLHGTPPTPPRLVTCDLSRKHRTNNCLDIIERIPPRITMRQVQP